MKRKWLVSLVTLNICVLFFATGYLMVDFAILTPERLHFEVGNVESIKAAIFEAQTQGVEMMRRSALTSGAALATTMLLNLIVLCSKCFKEDGQARNFARPNTQYSGYFIDSNNQVVGPSGLTGFFLNQDEYLTRDNQEIGVYVEDGHFYKSSRWLKFLTTYKPTGHTLDKDGKIFGDPDFPP